MYVFTVTRAKSSHLEFCDIINQAVGTFNIRPDGALKKVLYRHPPVAGESVSDFSTTLRTV